MKKILAISVLMCLFLAGCKDAGKPAIELSELQVTACNTADNAGTCDTRLGEVGIVLKEDCCEALGKCC